MNEIEQKILDQLINLSISGLKTPLAEAVTEIEISLNPWVSLNPISSTFEVSTDKGIIEIDKNGDLIGKPYMYNN